MPEQKTIPPVSINIAPKGSTFLIPFVYINPSRKNVIPEIRESLPSKMFASDLVLSDIWKTPIVLQNFLILA